MTVDTDLDEEQQIQEAQYEFPYHYIPELDHNGTFSQTRQWPWGYRYMAGIQVVIDQLEKVEFNSIIDIGCGDGRFLHELNKNHSQTDMSGVDYSQRAIDFANAMNPIIDFECGDITEDKLDKQYDVATLIEVLEHIPPDRLTNFIDSCTDVIKNEGMLILTVPHKNKGIQAKHYQHFTRDELTNLLREDCKRMEFFPFDQQSRILSLTQKLLGGRGTRYVITHKNIKSAFWRMYKNRFLYTTENKCSRICMVCYL